MRGHPTSRWGNLPNDVSSSYSFASRPDVDRRDVSTEQTVSPCNRTTMAEWSCQSSGAAAGNGVVGGGEH
ncbi:hypothetical protein GWI33_016725 [Rhynchophorus ferrugineus]|uniref:Uncharacterized protein n=1 Tax=Rhynchophorus ferrugineus TaxID=354439 RepID=A0A834M335_RHYFE|nr:hypothetical protein GWI33_016725 [Rhynchophorus ferrugineus]